MKRFHFKLDRLLKIREYHEREWEVKLANASRLCIELEHEIDHLSRERAETVLGSVGPTEESPILDVNDLAARQRYLTFLDHRTGELSETLAVREVEREEVRSKLAEASKARKVLEKLKERRSGEYTRDAARHTAKTLDEIAGSALARLRLKGEG
ncbi:flagellar export protein FliJ [Salinispira pacifica]